MSSVDWDILWSTCTPSLKLLSPLTSKIRKATKNVEIGMVTFSSYSELSKVADLTLTHLHLALALDETPFEFRRVLWRQKTRIPGLSCGVVSMILGLAIFDTTPACDGRTHDGIYCASTASRGKN